MRALGMWVLLAIGVGVSAPKAHALPITTAPLVVRLDAGDAARRAAARVAPAPVDLITSRSAPSSAAPIVVPALLRSAASMIRLGPSSGALRIRF